MTKAYWESAKNSTHSCVQTLRVETLWVVYFSKIYDFDRWRIGLKGFPGVTGSNHCNVLFNGLGEISRGSILSESSKNVMGSSFDPRSHMRLHLLRFQICSFWHAITLGSPLSSAAKLKSFCVIEIMKFIYIFCSKKGCTTDLGLYKTVVAS